MSWLGIVEMGHTGLSLYTTLPLPSSCNQPLYLFDPLKEIRENTIEKDSNQISFFVDVDIIYYIYIY